MIGGERRFFCTNIYIWLDSFYYFLRDGDLRFLEDHQKNIRYNITISFWSFVLLRMEDNQRLVFFRLKTSRRKDDARLPA
jgi:hypothetical protein